MNGGSNREIENLKSNEKSLEEATELSDLVSSILHHSYDWILKDFINRRGLIVKREVWWAITLSIFSASILFFNPPWYSSLFLFGYGLFVFVKDNSRWFRSELFPSQTDRVEMILKNIDSTSFNEIRSLVNYEFPLREMHLRRIFDSKFANVDALHLLITQCQDTTAETVSHLLKKNILQKLSDRTVRQYLRGAAGTLTRNLYMELNGTFRDRKSVLKTLIACNPQYVQKHPILQFFSYRLLALSASFRYGYGKLVTFVFSTWFLLYILSEGSKLTGEPIIPTIPPSELVGFIFGMFMVTALLTLFLLYLVRTFIRFWFWILYLAAKPDAIQ